MISRRKQTISWIVAALLVMAGLVMGMVGLLTPITFGWFAYQPLASGTFVGGDGGMFVSSAALSGGALLALGLIFVAFLWGVRVGSRRGVESVRDERER